MNGQSTQSFPASIAYSAVLGQILVRKRHLLGGMHQKTIADAIGLSQSAYSKLESGQSTFSLVHLRQIARQLGTNPHELLLEVDTYARDLEAQGVTVTDERPINSGEVLIGLGILAALFAAAGSS